MFIVHFSLGSNLGDRLNNLRQALTQMEAAGLGILRSSSVYETAPVELREQPDFLNLVVAAHGALPPAEILPRCQEIERRAGREKTLRFGPRVLDIDLLLAGDLCLETERLILPHPRMHLRRFVLVPLNEIDPQVIHPLSGKTIAGLLAGLEDPARVERYCGPIPGFPIIQRHDINKT